MASRDTNDHKGGASRHGAASGDMNATGGDTKPAMIASPDAGTPHDATRAVTARRHDLLRPEGIASSASAVIASLASPGARTDTIIGASRLPARSLPVARLADLTPASGTHLVVTAMDVHGRLADRTPLLALRWIAGQPIEFAVNGQAGVIVVRRGGPEAVTSQGRLRLPARVQRVLRLAAGDRLLVAAIIRHDLLIAHTMAAVDAMVLAYHSTFRHGEPS